MKRKKREKGKICFFLHSMSSHTVVAFSLAKPRNVFFEFWHYPIYHSAVTVTFPEHCIVERKLEALRGTSLFFYI